MYTRKTLFTMFTFLALPAPTTHIRGTLYHIIAHEKTYITNVSRRKYYKKK